MYEKILAAAVRVALAKGLAAVTRAAVARNARVAKGSVSYHFGSMGALVTAIIDHAVKTDAYSIIAAAVVQDHPAVKKLPQDVKERALLTLAAA